MTKEEALDLALEALESCTPEDTSTGHVVWPSYDEQAVEQAITAIKQARSAPVQEPVAWRAWFDADNGARWLFTLWPEEERWLDVKWEPLYTTPPAAKRQWTGLTDEEYGAMYNTHLRNGGPIQHFARAIEAKLKEKNT